MLILYTHNLQGDLGLLPRLYTFMQQIKAERRALLLDLGASCAPDVWHCAATGGRSTLIVLDTMGYHAANADHLSDAARYKLQGVVNLAALKRGQAWRYHVPPERDEGIIAAVEPAPALKLCIVLSAAAETTLTERMLRLQALNAGQIGAVEVDVDAQHIIAQHIHEMPQSTRPAATIAATVEFVEDEARRR